ncbi:MAG: endonuclease/exonuclease/phosphatase family protein [Chitinophagaceae bacterium]
MRQIKLVIIYCCLMLIIGCSKNTPDPLPPPPPPPPPPVTYDGTLRIMTYNIHHANPPASAIIDVNGIANIIKLQNPDLVALQEIDVNTTRSGTSLNQAAELGRLTGLKYYFAKTIDYASGEYGVAILSKYTMDVTKNTLLPSPGAEQRILATALITLPDGKKIVFASTHLDAQTSETNRLLQINKIVEILQPETNPVIIGGDFNAAPGTNTINALDAAFTRTCITSCGFTIPATNANKTIDFIAYKPSSSFTVLEHKVINEKLASDHLPVLAVLKLK